MEKEQEQNEKKQQKSRRRRRKRRSKEQEEKMEMEMQINCQPTEALVTGGDQQLQSEEHIVDIPEQQITDPEAAEDSLFMRYSGCLSFLENFILGSNQGNQIWRLRSLSATCLYIAAVVDRFSLTPLNQLIALRFAQHQSQNPQEFASLLDTVDGEQEAMEQTSGTDRQAEDIG
ncbi:uncharacterized protein LOC144573646 [Carex rostrata]